MASTPPVQWIKKVRPLDVSDVFLAIAAAGGATPDGFLAMASEPFAIES